MKELWQIEKYCENELKCLYCNDYTLVGVCPDDICLLCSKCGRFFGFDEEKNILLEYEK